MASDCLVNTTRESLHLHLTKSKDAWERVLQPVDAVAVPRTSVEACQPIIPFPPSHLRFTPLQAWQTRWPMVVGRGWLVAG